MAGGKMAVRKLRPYQFLPLPLRLRPGPDLQHSRVHLHAVLAELRFEDGAHARVLVLVLDLAATLADALVSVPEEALLVAGERIADAPEGDRQVARREWGGVEVLV